MTCYLLYCFSALVKSACSREGVAAAGCRLDVIRDDCAGGIGKRTRYVAMCFVIGTKPRVKRAVQRLDLFETRVHLSLRLSGGFTKVGFCLGCLTQMWEPWPLLLFFFTFCLAMTFRRCLCKTLLRELQCILLLFEQYV